MTMDQDAPGRAAGHLAGWSARLMDDRTSLVVRTLGRWRLILAVFAVCAACGVCVVLQVPRKYTAETVTILDPRRNQVLEGLATLGTLQHDTVAINSEVSLFYLPELALDVVRHLKLTELRDYQPAERGRLAELLETLAEWARDLVPVPAPRAVAEVPDADRREAVAIAEFQRRLAVVNEPRTYTIRVRYTALDPAHAAEVANAVAELQIAGQRDARIQSVREASAWLNSEIGALQERVTRAETAEQTYRRTYGLGDDKAVSIAQQEVNALTLQVAIASGELSQAHAKLRQARAGIVTALEEEMRVASARETNVREELDRARARLDQVLAAEAGLRPLAREAAASRALLEDLMRRARNADSQIAAPRPESRVVSRALAPATPSNWGPGRLVPAAVAASGGLALGLGLLLAALERGFRSAGQIERQFGLDVIGEVPQLRGGGQRVRQLIVEQPTSGVSESIRSIAATVIGDGCATRVIQVTSPLPGDGKTVLATALAQALALSGRSCLLIDADLRRPAAHRVLNLPQRAGFSEVLGGAIGLDQAITKVLPGPLSFMTAGETVADPLKLLEPERLEPFFAAVRQAFDVVILDSPPILPVCDGTLLAPHADHVLLALRWNVTSAAATARALSLLRRRRPAPPSVVLTQVLHGRMIRYEEGGYGMDTYYGRRSWTRGGPPRPAPSRAADA